MIPLLLTVALLITLSTGGQCTKNVSCLATEDGWFYISSTKRTYEDAADHCKKLGGQIAILDSEEKSDSVNKLISERDDDINKNKTRQYLLGAKEAISLSETRFYWQDERNTELKNPCSYVNWCNGEPEKNSDDCVVIIYKDGDYCWHNVDCWTYNYYVCEL